MGGDGQLARMRVTIAEDKKMSTLPETGSNDMPEDLGNQWRRLMTLVLGPADIPDLGDVILTFSEGLGFDEHLADPEDARGQCIRVSWLFESMCAHRGITARTVDGLCFTRLPRALPGGQQEEPWAGHTAVAVGVPARRGGNCEIVIDWTARQFDPGCPVPLIVTLADWRAFWRDPASAAAQQRESRAPRAAAHRPRATVAGTAARSRGRTAG